MLVANRFKEKQRSGQTQATASELTKTSILIVENTL